MTRFFILCLAAVTTTGCLPQFSLAASDDTVWKLTELNGKQFTAEAELTLPKEGQIRGRGPCNSFFATAEGALSSLTIGPIGSTKMACPDLGLESDFFATLAEIVWIDSSAADQLVLGDDKGPRMILVPAGK